MPIYRPDTIAQHADWVEVDDFEFILLDRRRQRIELAPQHPREIVVCLSGEVVVQSDNGQHTLKKKDWAVVPASGMRVMSTQHDPLDGQYDPLIGSSELLRIAGHWNEITHVGMFRRAPGTPLELHYHDNEEYWFLFRGHFTAQYGGTDVELRQGDMLVTGGGIEHGIADPAETLEGIGFTTSMYGKKRLAHLTREKDGTPVPMREL